MNAEEHHALSLLLLAELQRVRTARAYGQVWEKVHCNACAISDRVGAMTAEELTEAYDVAGHRIRPWRELYSPVDLESWARAEEIAGGLVPGGEARLDLYWRALDRFPGGNADFQTICYTFDCKDGRVLCRVASNWDGQPCFGEYEPRRVASLVADDAPTWKALLASVAALPRNSECTILDTISRCVWNNHHRSYTVQMRA